MDNIFDSHAHYDDDAFDADRYELLSSLKEQGVCGVINCGCDIASSKASVALAQQFDFVYSAVGFHPHDSKKFQSGDLELLRQMATLPKTVAIGEIGLDYHYDFSPRETQKELFEAQLQLAKELNMPVIVHDREAHADTMELLKQYQPKGVMHCYSGSAEMAKELIKLGMYIGIGGAITFKNAKKSIEVVKAIPQDKLLIETDSPYMTPVPHRGKRCDSTYIPYTAEKIAEILETTAQDILNLTVQNAYKLFQIKGE